MEQHFTDTATQSRSTTSGYKTTYAEVATFPCHIQPMSEEYTQGQMGRDQVDFRMFSTAEVRIGDRITDQNDKKYEVYAAARYSFRSKQHYQSKMRAV